MKAPYTKVLAEYIQALEYSDIPEEAIRGCKLHALDTVGVALAGTLTPWARIVRDYAESRATVGRATVLGSWRRTQSITAAFVNGTLSHSLDYDDDPGLCHIGAVIVPASLALAEETKASGMRFITAVIIGYDIVTRVEEAFNGEDMFARGFHPTSVCGVFGAAAAASKILGLDNEGIANALGIAGSFSSGIMAFLSDGSMTKRIHPGWAAQGGITAALLAEKGFTGPKSVFEGKFGVKAYSGTFNETKLIADLGKRFDVLNSSLKKHPSCLYNASAIDGILEVTKEEGIKPEDIRRIDVGVRRVALDLVGTPIERKQNPETVLDAQMSMPYSLAVALVDGEAYLEQFSESRISDPRITHLARKIWVSLDSELDRLPPNNLASMLNVELRDGRKISKRVDYYHGDPRNPLTQAEVEKKFKRCAGTILKSEDVDALANKILDLDRIVDVRTVLGGFRP